MAGFIWQLRHLLLHLLAAELDEVVELETYDDIAVSTGSGQVVAAVQTKHSWGDELLTPYSAELWKTLRAWSHLLSTNQITSHTSLILSTTAKVGPDLHFLTKKTKLKPNIDTLRQKLDSIATKASNRELSPAFIEWNALARIGHTGRGRRAGVVA